MSSLSIGKTYPPIPSTRQNITHVIQGGKYENVKRKKLKKCRKKKKDKK
jgi:hypothetical protein